MTAAAMFELSVKTHFSAAHSLVGYEGKCSILHGHNWEVEVFVRGRELDRIGILIDFKLLKQAVREVMETLDHAHLNVQDGFEGRNPTSENIARLVYDQLSARLNNERYRIQRVLVRETPDTAASYWLEEDAP